MRLKGITVVITAAGQGIGRAAAERCATEGAEVWATDRDVNLLAGMTNCRSLQLDVTDAAAITTAIDHIGRIDAVFNCAGWVANGSILHCSDADWDRSFNLNVTAMFRMMRAVLPGMVERGSGSIVNMSSVASSLKGVPNRFAYGASKAAVIGMTKAVAADYVGRNIRCNAICPGTVDTPSLHDRLSASGDHDVAMEAFVARQPLGRLGRPEEIAALVAYLVSPDSAFMTGQALGIDGGWSI